MPLVPKNHPNNSTQQRQSGLEIKGLADKLKDFAEENYSGQISIPIGWFIDFFDDSGQPIIEIKDLKPMELRLSIYEGDSTTPITINSSWRHVLKLGYRAELRREPISLDISAVEMIQHRKDDIAQFATSRDAANNNAVLKIWTVPYGVGAITGISQTLRAAYLDYDTMMQMHLAYVHHPSPEKLRFIFTGAEVHYGDMAGTTFEQERFEEWNPIPNVQDPSITSTLKIEPIYPFPGNPKYYVSANMYTAFEGEVKKVLMPGVFLLPACKRYWHEIPTEEG